MPFPDDLPTYQGSELHYWYDNTLKSDLLFWDIIQNRTMLLIDRAYDQLPWCNDYSIKLYNAILPYTEFVLQYYHQGGGPYGITREERLEKFKTHIVYYAFDSYTNGPYIHNDLEFSIPRPQPLPDTFKSIFEITRLKGNNQVLIQIPATPNGQLPITGDISYLVGMYRPYAYTAEDVYHQSFKRVKFKTKDTPQTLIIKVKHHAPKYPQQTLPVDYESVRVVRQMSNDLERYGIYMCDICAGSVVVNCTDSGLQSSIEAAFDPTLLYKNIDSTFAQLYNPCSSINKTWYRCRHLYANDSVNLGLKACDWNVPAQGFILMGSLYGDTSISPTAGHEITGTPLFIPLPLYDAVPIYFDDASIYTTDREVYMGYYSGYFDPANMPNNLTPVARFVEGENSFGLWRGHHLWVYDTQFYPIAIAFVQTRNDGNFQIIESIPCLGLGSSKGNTYNESYVLGGLIRISKMDINAEPVGQNIYGHYYSNTAFSIYEGIYNNISNFREDYNTRFNSCPQKDYWKQLAMGEQQSLNADNMLNILLEEHEDDFLIEENLDAFLGNFKEDFKIYDKPLTAPRLDRYNCLDYWAQFTRENTPYELPFNKRGFRQVYQFLYKYFISSQVKTPSPKIIANYEEINLMTNPEKNFSPTFGVDLISKGSGNFTGSNNFTVEIIYHPRQIHRHNWSLLMTIIQKIYDMEEQMNKIYYALGAEEFAYSDDLPDPTPAHMNLGRTIHDIAHALGISFNLDGTIRSIRSSKEVQQGQTIPAGWYFGQFGHNNGGSSVGQQGGLPEEERLGIVYQVKSNQIVADAQGVAGEIKEGGYILCENLPQYIAALERDLDKALDLQNLGGGLVNFNGKTLVVEGLFSFLQEILVVDADTNMTTEQSRISSLITQQLAKEILKGLGLPTQIKKFDFTLQSNDQTWLGVMGGAEIVAEVPYNGIADQSPTLSSLIFNVLENVAIGNIGKLQLNEEEAIKAAPITTPDPEVIPKPRNIFQGALTVIQNWFKSPSVEKQP